MSKSANVSKFLVALVSFALALSGAISPAWAEVPAPADGEYVCTTGVLRAGDDTSPAYTISNGVVASGSSCVGAVVLPEGVASIGESAFYEAASLNSINIPSSVTEIGASAFYLTGLSSISIPASVTSIGLYAICETAVTSITVDSDNPNYASQDGVLFNKDLTTLIAYPSGNTATSYIVPSSVTTIEDSSFYKSLFLESITVPNSVTTLQSYAFGNSPNLETITFAADSPITAINVYTFAYLPKLTSLELPSNVTTIGEGAFAYSTALTSVTIPASVTSISIAFGSTPSLAAINVDSNNQTYSSINGVLFDKDASVLFKYPAAKRGTSYEIPSSVTSIKGVSFENAASLTSITIPASVTYIEDFAFENTTALTDFNFLGDAPTNMGADSFGGIAAGARANISFGASGFGSESTWNGLVINRDLPIANGNYICTTGELDLEGENSTYFIFNGVVSNGTGCSGAVVIPEGVTGIGEEAFSSESSVPSITSITIPASVTSIGEYAFYLTSTLRELRFLGNAPTLAETCAMGCFDTDEVKVYIKASATGFGQELTWNGLTIRRDFSNYTGRIKCETGLPLAVDDTSPAYTVTNGVATSGSGCVEAVVIPDGVISIGADAFSDATSLTSITIADSVTSIGESAFRGAAALTSITIPANVTSIGDSAFRGAAALTSINIPNGVTSIGTDSFRHATSLTSITIPSSVTSIGDSAFRGATALASIIIPASVTSIGNNAFQEATALTSITIPSSVTSIGGAAFYGATSLSDVNFQGDAPTVGQMSMSFGNVANGAKAHVSDIATGFGNDSTWRGLVLVRYPTDGEYVCATGLLRAEGDPSPAYTITNRVVTNGADCSGAVVIPGGVREIGFEAFAGSSLTSISVPSSVTSIGESAFSGAAALTSITIPAGVTSIGNYAFYDAVKIIDVVFLGDAPTFGSQVFDYIAYDYDPAPEATFHISAAAEGFGNLSTWTTWNGGENKPIAFKLYLVAPPVNGTYVCTTGLLRADSDVSEAFTVIDGVVTDGSDCSGAVEIPNGVREIGADAFAGASLTSISIPSSVTSIEGFAFQTAENLQTVSFAQGSQLESIGVFAFNNASALASITIPARVTRIGDNAFYYATSLRDVFFLGNAPTVGSGSFTDVAPEATAHIRSTATGFGTEPNWNGLVKDRAAPPEDGPYECTTGLPRTGNDTSATYTITNSVVESGVGCSGAVVIPDGVTAFADAAFELSAITSISIPEGVTSIGVNAFYGSGLTSIAIPASVTSIEENVVRDTSVTSFMVDSYNENYAAVDGVLFNKDLSTLISYPSGKSEVSYSIPASVTSIEHYAFSGATALTSITIPASVTSIGYFAFYGTTALRDIYFQGDAPEVGMFAFDGIANQAKAHITANATGFGTESTWNGLIVQADIVLDGYYECTSGLPRAGDDTSAAYEISNGVVSGGAGCSSIVVLPEGVTQVGDFAFIGGAFTYIFIPSSVTRIGDGAFQSASNLNSITIPAGVTSIGGSAFNGASALTSITFAQGSQLELIDGFAFAYAGALTSVTIPASVETIGMNAFYGAALKDVYFLGNAPTVGEQAFSFNARGAKAHISLIAEGFGTEPRWNGLVLEEYLVAPPANGFYVCTTGLPGEGSVSSMPSPTYVITDGVVTSGRRCSGSVVIPDGVTSIGEDAFNEAALTSISIPSSVTSIGTYAFFDARSLQTVSFAQGSKLASIGSSAFSNTTALTSITIPASVTTIGTSAFAFATALTSITIPASVTTIEGYVFEGTDALIDYNFLGDAPANIDVNAFSFHASGAEAHIRFSATGFGSESTWNGLVIDRAAPAIYAVTYESTGGTSVGSGTFTEGGSIQAAPVSTRAGYTLAGWAARENGDVVAFPYAPGSANDITLHAIWTPIATTAVAPAGSSSVVSAKVIITSSVAKFPSGTSTLTKDGKAAIKKIVKKSGKDATFTITGVTTKVIGVSESRTKVLAKARAKKVKAYLVKLGVNKSNISVEIKIVESGVIPKTKILAKHVTQ